MTKFVFCFILVAGRVLRVALCIKLDINELVEGTINQTKHDSVPRRLFYHRGQGQCRSSDNIFEGKTNVHPMQLKAAHATETTKII